MFSRIAVRWASYTSQTVRRAEEAVPSGSSASMASIQAFLDSQSIPETNTLKLLSRQSFDKLNSLLESDKSIVQNAPSTTMDAINGTLIHALEQSAENDRQYYISQLKESPVPWLRMYPMIYSSDSKSSMETIRQFFEKQPKGSKSVIVPSPTLGYLFDTLIKDNHLTKFLNLYEWLQAVKYPILNTKKKSADKYYAKYLRRFVQRCIIHPTTTNNNLLAKFFETHILYTGPEERVKEAFRISKPLLESMIGAFQRNGNITEYSKSVSYYMKRLKKRDNITLLNEWRFKSRVVKFDMYINKLGPYQVLENGMFHKFNLIYNKNVKLEDHLLHFTNELTMYLSKLDSSKITLPYFILLIEFMHGLHRQEYKEKFSKDLNPDIQMARIYRSVIKKTVDPDPMIIQKYNEIINMENDKKYTHMKDGIPKQKTVNQRFNNESADKKTFQPLPLQIVLRVIYNLTQAPAYEKNTKQLVTIAVMLFQAMVMERQLHPNQGSFGELIKIVQTHSATSEQAPAIMSIHRKYYKAPSPQLKAVLDSYGLRKDGSPVVKAE